MLFIPVFKFGLRFDQKDLRLPTYTLVVETSVSVILSVKRLCSVFTRIKMMQRKTRKYTFYKHDIFVLSNANDTKPYLVIYTFKFLTDFTRQLFQWCVLLNRLFAILTRLVGHDTSVHVCKIISICPKQV